MLLSLFASLILQVTNPFWSYWGDGKAEISRYETIQNRYGSDRKTEEIFIYVTEPFNLEKQVKSDSYNFENKNHAQVLKLNHIKDFQTGVYDYNLMTSVFTSVDPFKMNEKNFDKGEVVKITFTGQEWCGHVFQQLNRTEDAMQSRHFSYFESAGDESRNIPLTENTFFTDNLFIDVRELIRELPEGEIELYPSLEYTRLFHRPYESHKVTLKKSDSTYKFESKSVDVKIIDISNKQIFWKFIVEKEYPNKILYYEFKQDDSLITKAKLLKSVRLLYWQLNNRGDEKYLKELGL